MNAHRITLCLKHDDCATFQATDANGNVLVDVTGYLPYVGNLGGDDTILQIDNATGKILNWESVTNVEIAKLREEPTAHDE